jgi:predicted dehydrogenase
MEYQMRNWYYFNWLCGDHIAEQHIHNLDVGNWVMGSLPVKAQGMGGREVRRGKDHGEIFDHHYVEFTYENGAKMFSHCRHIRSCWNSVSEHAHGTQGTANISSSRIDGPNAWRFRGRSPNPYEVEHADLVASIRAGKPYNEAEYGATSSMTSILGRMATYSGQEIKWSDAINSKISLAPKEYAWDATPPTIPDANGNYPIPVPGLTKVV